jgi:hypothetical protein
VSIKCGKNFVSDVTEVPDDDTYGTAESQILWLLPCEVSSVFLAGAMTVQQTPPFGGMLSSAEEAVTCATLPLLAYARLVPHY